MGRHGRPAAQLSVQQKWPEMAKLVTDEMVHAFAAVGTYDEIASVIKKRFAGVNRLSFDMPVRNDHDRGVLKEIIQDLRRHSSQLRERRVDVGPQPAHQLDMNLNRPTAFRLRRSRVSPERSKRHSSPRDPCQPDVNTEEQQRIVREL